MVRHRGGVQHRLLAAERHIEQLCGDGGWPTRRPRLEECAEQRAKGADVGVGVGVGVGNAGRRRQQPRCAIGADSDGVQ